MTAIPRMKLLPKLMLPISGWLSQDVYSVSKFIYKIDSRDKLIQMTKMVLSLAHNSARLLWFFVIWVLAVMFSVPACKSPGKLTGTEAGTIVINDKELIPEGITLHPGTGTIYLSSLSKNKIVSLDSRGTCKDLITSGQDGFMKGLGIKFDKDGKTLWACSASLDTVKSVSGLFGIDLSSGKVVHSYLHHHDSTSLFNDLAIHSSGDIYITDTYQGAVYRYQRGSKKIETWLRNEQLTLANGIVFSDDEKILFVASGDKGVQRIEIDTKEVRPVTRGKRTDYAIDGLLYYNKTLIGVIGWPQHQVQNHRILRYHLTDDYYFSTADTLLINKSYLRVPTTAALKNNRLYVIGKTNLDLYNKAQQTLDIIKDSLEFPLVVQVGLK